MANNLLAIRMAIKCWWGTASWS